MKPVRVTENERKVLAALAREYGMEADCLYFREIARRAEIDEKKARRFTRALARKGLAEYVRCLFDDEGMVAGSGYRCTRAGYVAVYPEPPA